MDVRRKENEWEEAEREYWEKMRIRFERSVYVAGQQGSGNSVTRALEILTSHVPPPGVFEGDQEKTDPVLRSELIKSLLFLLTLANLVCFYAAEKDPRRFSTLTNRRTGDFSWIFQSHEITGDRMWQHDIFVALEVRNQLLEILEGLGKRQIPIIRTNDPKVSKTIDYSPLNPEDRERLLRTRYAGLIPAPFMGISKAMETDMRMLEDELGTQAFLPLGFEGDIPKQEHFSHDARAERIQREAAKVGRSAQDICVIGNKPLLLVAYKLLIREWVDYALKGGRTRRIDPRLDEETVRVNPFLYLPQQAVLEAEIQQKIVKPAK